MRVFERYLTVWVALCIMTGIGLGQFLPSAFQAIGRTELARVNIPAGLLICVTIIPMLVKIDFGALAQVKSHWSWIGVTLFVNRAVKPFSMAFLGWLFIRHVFAPYLPSFWSALSPRRSGAPSKTSATPTRAWLPLQCPLLAEGSG